MRLSGRVILPGKPTKTRLTRKKRADAEVIGIALLKKDWGYGRRNMNAVLDRASEHLRRMRGR